MMGVGDLMMGSEGTGCQVMGIVVGHGTRAGRGKKGRKKALWMVGSGSSVIS